MRTRYSRPQSEKPWITDHVEIKTRRVGSVTRVYAKIVHGYESIEKGSKDFASFAEVLDLFGEIDKAMIAKGWRRRESG